MTAARALVAGVAAMVLAACGPQQQSGDSAPDDTAGASAPADPGAADTRTASAGPTSPVFVDVAAETGLLFDHFVGATGEYFMTEVMGAGVALFDYDGDGDLDAYLMQGSSQKDDGSLDDSLFPVPASSWPGNRLFRNERIPSGELAFTDVTDGSGLAHEGYGMGAAVGDIDNDGDLDLYVTNDGDNALFANLGDGTFEDITVAAGVNDARWSTAAAFADYDGDSDLDLFVVNYVAFDPARNTVCTSSGGRRDYCGPQVYPPLDDRLFRNDGNGRFTDVSEAAGIAGRAGPGLGAVWADFDGDDRVDLFVANDGAANFMWMNRGGGRFEDTGVMAGTAYNQMGSPEASMGVTAGDFDGDGDEDLFMTHLVAESNTLYLNDGRGGFFDATDQAGLGSTSLPQTGFGAAFFDYDNDGLLDLYIANGNVKLEESRVAVSDYPFEQTNQLFRNLDERRFEDVSARAGPAFRQLAVSRGAAFGDIDNDGDTDILVTNNNGRAELLLNQVGNERHWLSVRLEGTSTNRDGIGARVALFRADRPALWRRVHTDGSYLSANDLRVHFGLGDDPAIEAIGVAWPEGQREFWRGITPDTVVTLRQGTGEPGWPAEIAPPTADAVN